MLMLNLIQQTVAGFSRSSSRRMDAELCVVNLCQPELDTDTDSILARLTNIEDRIRVGSAIVPEIRGEKISPVPESNPVSETKPLQQDIPEAISAAEIEDTAPIGFWTDVATAVRNELNPAMKGFFATTPNAPIRGVLSGDKLMLLCANQFVMEIVNKPEILSLVALKASAKIGRQLRVLVSDETEAPKRSENLEQLLDFGRAHSNIITVND